MDDATADSEPAESSTFRSWRIALVVFHGLFTVFACVVMVQFYKQRKTFFLKERYPNLAMLQLAACTFCILLKGFVSPMIIDSVAHCFLRRVLSDIVTSLVMFLYVARAWKLYWRIFVGKHFAQSRTVLRTRLEKQTSDLSSASTLDAATASRTQFKTWKYQAMKYSILGFFGLLLLSEAVAALANYISSDLDCDGPIDSISRGFNMLFLVSGVIAATCMLVIVRKFQDNFNIHLEILRTTVVYFIACPALLILEFYPIYIPDGLPVSREVKTFLLEIFFVIVGVYPLRDQRKLDQRVNECTFDHLESLEDMLQDPAARVALEAFMRREFCNEMLEFYESVEKFKRKYELHSPAKRLNAARVIHAQFIVPGAPAQINLSLTHVAEIHVKLFGGADRCQSNTMESASISDAPFEVFDEAQREIVHLIRRDPFVRFQISRLPPEQTRRKSLSLRRLSRVNAMARPSLAAPMPATEVRQSLSRHEQIPSAGRKKSGSRRLSLPTRRESTYGQVPESA